MLLLYTKTVPDFREGVCVCVLKNMSTIYIISLCTLFYGNFLMYKWMDKTIEYSTNPSHLSLGFDNYKCMTIFVLSHPYLLPHEYSEVNSKLQTI